jgi:hypothetical protein
LGYGAVPVFAARSLVFCLQEGSKAEPMGFAGQGLLDLRYRLSAQHGRQIKHRFCRRMTPEPISALGASVFTKKRPLVVSSKPAGEADFTEATKKGRKLFPQTSFPG